MYPKHWKALSEQSLYSAEMENASPREILFDPSVWQPVTPYYVVKYIFQSLCLYAGKLDRSFQQHCPHFTHQHWFIRLHWVCGGEAAQSAESLRLGTHSHPPSPKYDLHIHERPRHNFLHFLFTHVRSTGSCSVGLSIQNKKKISQSISFHHKNGRGFWVHVQRHAG